YPYRHIQIILRIYRSPAEVLMGFDVDCCSVGFDGRDVWALPRAHNAFVTQQNRVDMTRRSPSYEMRLAKYSERGFEILVPALDRDRIDPTIYERSFEKLHGLARLLVLEALNTPEERFTFLEKRREQRNRPAHKNAGTYARQNRSNDLKASAFENNDYETVHLPYGEKWTAARIVKQLFTKDMVLNSPWYSKNRGHDIKFHRHPCFFGTMADVMADCCGHCPDVSKLPEDERPSTEESELYIQGDVSFIKDDPGRQAIGSFHPITSDDWAIEAYIEKPREDICAAALRGDIAAAKELIRKAAETVDADMIAIQNATTPVQPDATVEAAVALAVNARDHIGRTPLQLAVIGGHHTMIELLLEHGARVCARISDGRTVLHLAAQQGDVAAVRMLLAQSEKNRIAKEEREAAAAANAEADDADSETSSIDIIEKSELSDFPGEIDWSDESTAESKADEDDDIMEIDIPDWDLQMSAMEHAIFFGHLEVVKVLVEAGADPRRVIKFKASRDRSAAIHYPLALCMTVRDRARGIEIARYLIEKGARATQLNLNHESVFHVAIAGGMIEFVRLFIELDPRTLATVNCISSRKVTPLYSAVKSGHREMVELLLDNGAK
ncbi:ankyrin repeat-containing domain protein, partial [Thamnocephalis sphaerospora]